MSRVISLRLRVDNTDYIVRTFENTSVQITRSIRSFDNITSDQGVVTRQTFRVPLDEGLIEALGDLGNPAASANTDIRKSIEGSVLIDGFPVYNGSFQVLSIYLNPSNDTKEVELLFKGEETNLKAVLDDVTLVELLDGETLPYEIDEIASYYNNPTTYITSNGYTWDLIDWGQNLVVGTAAAGELRIDDENNPLDQTSFKPSVTIDKIIDLINSELGINFTFTTNAQFLLDQIIPLHNNESNIPVLDTSPLNNTGFMDRTTAIDYSNNDDGAQSEIVNFNSATNYDNTVFEVTDDKYIAQVTGAHQFRLDLDLNMSISTASSVVRFSLFRVDVRVNTVKLFTVYENSFTASNSVSKDLDVKVDFEITNLEDGDEVQLYYTWTQADVSGPTSYTTVLNQTAASRWSCVSSPVFVSTSNVDIPRNIDPDLTCWDVIRTLIAQCNGVVTGTSPNFLITPWVDWIDDNSEVYPLDDKIDYNKDIQIQLTGVKGAKSIRFTYEESELFYNQKYREFQGQEYGELFIPNTGSDISSGEYELRIPFVNPVPVPFDNSSATIVRVIDEEGELIKTKPMLLPKSDYVYNQTLYLQDFYGGTVYERNEIPATLHWLDDRNGGFATNDNNFGTSLTFFAATGYPNETLYERFWRDYIRESYGENSRLYSLSVEMPYPDFQRLVMNEKLRLNGQYFRFNSIDNYNLNKKEPVEIEIVQRLTLLNSDIAPYYPFDVIEGVVQWKDSSDNSDVGDGSTEPAADIEESCDAYGFFYDSGDNIGVQLGQILPI